MVPPYDFPGKGDLRAKLDRQFIDQIWALPRQIGYNNYIARTYGVPPTREGFDSVVSRHIGSDATFRAYVASILDRERIRTVVLQSAEADPVKPPTFLPAGRFVWTYPIVPLIQPGWAIGKNLATLQDVASAIDDTLETAVANGCAGLKNAAAYYRSLDIKPVLPADAEAAFTSLRAAEPDGYLAQGAPYYGQPALDQALRTYQDHLLKRIFVKAGQLDVPVIIHSAVALHPALRIEYNDPLALYQVFRDDEIQREATRFVVIHTGYPSHHLVAAMLSQFPNVFADVSFYSKFPGVLEETYRAFLSLAPSEKVMHGSDSNNVPEEMGYCSSNSRRVLARILSDFRTYYGWRPADCERIARNVLNANARRVFKIPS